MVILNLNVKYSGHTDIIFNGESVELKIEDKLVVIDYSAEDKVVSFESRYYPEMKSLLYHLMYNFGGTIYIVDLNQEKRGILCQTDLSGKVVMNDEYTSYTEEEWYHSFDGKTSERMDKKIEKE